MSISERLYIRWLPAEATEPTSTLVLTTPRGRFVDLRFLLPSASPTESDASPALTSLEWGFAGRSVGTLTHGKWIHEISSRTEHPEDEADEGDIFPHPTLPDVELERGRMRHPETGEVTEYEEAWKKIPVLPVGGPPSQEGRRVAVWLELQRRDPHRTGSIVRVGGYCQGILREGTSVSAQRWKWTGDAWEMVGQVGDPTAEMPCSMTWAEVPTGGFLSLGNSLWSFREVSFW
ncbi:hypothetical protein PYCCODRAFT_1456372 [Trametes coccinea BRFM310]|uniref:Protein HRI1 n=1 Tax=Trametes coccinea (strain BRFM310) TaxID=1353009 RepID=A0A1Y2J2J0_TRAC3|nr:hypothetical protein PYCCODRAFT_1456372 [Trametes coccinea BRFM310]